MNTQEVVDHQPKSYIANLLQNAASNAPVVVSDHLPRYGMSFLLPLPLLHQKSSNYIGDFNPKISNDPLKGNSENINFYPAFELIAFFGGRIACPFEKLPIYTDEVISPEPFDVGFNVSSQKGIDHIEKSAKDCALTAKQEFAETGYKEFESLIGFKYESPQKNGLDLCEKVLSLVLPLKDEKIFPRGDQFARIKNGFIFNAPFLDQIANFLRTQSMQRILEAKISPESVEVAKRLHLEIMDGVNSATKLANRILNETEAEMKNPQGVKKSYDEPDLRYDDAPIPTDLYCLAHTNRTELDNKQLQASTNIGREIAEPMVNALESFKSVFGGQIPSTLPQGVMTSEEVELMMTKQQEDFETRMAEMELKFAGMLLDAKGELNKEQPKTKK